jgi:rSAM/selenodomain-associated transferase 1
MIPTLGPEGAARLQERMTEHTLYQARSLAQHLPLQLEVCFAGGCHHRMKTWLGQGIGYRPQQGEDLGERLRQAFADAFADGCNRVAVIGTDCPQVDKAVLQHAFEALDQAELVVGPATDGGYYLLGLQRLVPQLFEDIAWGTERVLAQTLKAARSCALRTTQLERLADVDRPEDLPLWRTVYTKSMIKENAKW